jgi:putative oxidoreductase
LLLLLVFFDSKNKQPMKTSASLDPLSPHLLSVLRIMSGLLFLEHGTSKVLSFPHPVLHQGPPPAGLMAVLGQTSGVLELVGGVLLVIGLFTRITAFILSGEMAVAYFMVHAKMGFYPMDNHGEIAVLYCFVFLYLAAAGGGPWSLDRLRHRG